MIGKSLVSNPYWNDVEFFDKHSSEKMNARFNHANSVKLFTYFTFLHLILCTKRSVVSPTAKLEIFVLIRMKVFVSISSLNRS